MTYRVFSRGTGGEICFHDYQSEEAVLEQYVKISVDDCSTDLTLRGFPVFKGLIGPIPETSEIVRYETPEVFEKLTREWSRSRTRRRRPSLNAA